MGMKEPYISGAFAGGPGSLADSSRRDFMRAAAALLDGLGLPSTGVSRGRTTRGRRFRPAAISNFVRSGGPTSGDELSYLVSREVMRKFSPRLLVIIFSDVEVAHSGSYALHVAGIRLETGLLTRSDGRDACL